MNFLAAQDILVSDHRFQPGVLTDLEPAQLLHSQQGCSKAGKLKKNTPFIHACSLELIAGATSAGLQRQDASP